MRRFLTCVFAGTIFSFVVRAADTGVPPRAASTDYPAHDRADAAVLAATIIPTNQVSKMFSPEIAKQYLVVEVAIYPEGGVPFDVESSGFALRVGQRVGTYEHGDDPVYGRRQGVGTYTGVAVEAPGRADPPPPPDPRVDPRAVYDKIQRFALAEGATKVEIAGYLYFPQYTKRKKSDEIELKYAKDGVAVNLLLGKP